MKVWKQKFNNLLIPKSHMSIEYKTCSHLKVVLKGKPKVFGSDL